LELPRFLIVRLGALGDVVHAIPVAAALRRAFPDARIDWLVSAKHREILDLVPVIDRRLVINDRPSTPSENRNRSAQAGEVAGTSLLAAVRELRQARYDVAIDLQGLIKSALLARSSGAPRVVGFSSRYVRELAARIFYTDAHDPGRGGLYDPRETRHVVEINLGVLTALGITTPKWEFPIEEVDSDAARAIREQTGGRYALLNPGAAWPNKRWPPARLAAVAVQLRERHGLMSVVLWGPGEEALAADVVAGANGAAVLSPRTTIADLVALARRAALMVSGDTGPTHIAAALGTPLVGIYGPTRPSRNGPMSPLDITVSRDTTCQCHHLRRCRLDRMCLLDIEVAEVAAAVDRRLSAEPSRV
jgi:lipopolysaccharide heptosyltransferase I